VGPQANRSGSNNIASPFAFHWIFDVRCSPCSRPLPRRNFLKQVAGVAGFPMIIPSSVLGLGQTVAPSNRIILGGIGLGPRGRRLLPVFLRQADCQFVAIADPQRDRRNHVKRLTDRAYANEDCATYRDMAEVLERPDIDAVVIATGDRWHATASIYAARAGKDIYCEKPCAMSIRECRELDEEVTRHGRIFQAGTQRRSVPNFALAAELARSGQLGKLTKLHAAIVEPRPHLDLLPAQPEPDPEIIDWDKWQGPAFARPFNRAYCQGDWRNQRGLVAAHMLPDWGVHTIDICQWAADADGTAPVDYEADGTTISTTYASGLKLVLRLGGFENEGDWIEDIGTCPVRFEGEDAWVEAGDYKRIESSHPELLAGKLNDQLAGTDASQHIRNFLDCVKSRAQPVSNTAVMRRGHQACFAAAAAWKLGRKLTFDPTTETFPGDPAADALFDYSRRAPYTI